MPANVARKRRFDSRQLTACNAGILERISIILNDFSACCGRGFPAPDFFGATRRPDMGCSLISLRSTDVSANEDAVAAVRRFTPFVDDMFKVVDHAIGDRQPVV